jgi:hypothetical protein
MDVQALLPPSYVNEPVSVVYAYDVEDALIVTMLHIRGLCWDYDYQRTPALTPDELAAAVGRSRSALYRHLRQLKDDDEGGENAGCLGWLHIEPAGRRVILRPLVHITPEGRIVPNPTVAGPPARAALRPVQEAPNQELRQALLEIGVENPKRDELARREIDPLWVYAWQRWARHPHRRSLTNPVGNIILKLEAGEEPPYSFVREAEQWLQEQRWLEEQALARAEAEEEPSLEPEPEVVDAVPAETQRLWAGILGELQL